MADPAAGCVFCRIAAGIVPAPVVFEDDSSLAFLDHRPVFPGHTLLIPKQHFETLADLPAALIQPFFSATQLLARAIEAALAADGTFVAINNKRQPERPTFACAHRARGARRTACEVSSGRANRTRPRRRWKNSGKPSLDAVLRLRAGT